METVEAVGSKTNLVNDGKELKLQSTAYMLGYDNLNIITSKSVRDGLRSCSTK